MWLTFSREFTKSQGVVNRVSARLPRQTSIKHTRGQERDARFSYETRNFYAYGIEEFLVTREILIRFSRAREKRKKEILFFIHMAQYSLYRPFYENRKFL